MLWDEVAEEVAAEFPGVRYERVLVDALAARMVRDPASLDVVVASNLFGDILTDLAAAIQGGMGMAASANLAPGSALPGLFEPVHGSAPDIAGRGVANPAGAVWSAVLMLEHLGEAAAAASLMSALEDVCREGPRTRDLGGARRHVRGRRCDRGPPGRGLDRLSGEDQPESLDESRDASGSISSSYRAHSSARVSGGAWATPSRSTSSAKNRSKPAGEMISRIRAGSSPAFQNVCHWPRGLKIRSPRADDDLVAEQCSDPSLEHEAVLVLTDVPVERSRQRPRRHRMLDEREALVRLASVDHESHPDAAEEPPVAVRGPEHPRRRRRLHRSPSF